MVHQDTVFWVDWQALVPRRRVELRLRSSHPGNDSANDREKANRLILEFSDRSLLVTWIALLVKRPAAFQRACWEIGLDPEVHSPNDGMQA